MDKPNKQETKTLSTKAKQAVARLKTLSNKSQIAILLAVKEFKEQEAQAEQDK